MQSIMIQRASYTREQVENNLARSKDLLAQLDAGMVKPSKIIGAGYKDPKGSAYEYLYQSIGRWQMALAIMEEN